MIMTPLGTQPRRRSSPLAQYSSRLGHLDERRLAEVALVAAKEEAERSAAQAHAEVARRMSVQAELEHLATHDPLTGLPNRLLFNQRLEQDLALARRRGGKLALLFVDLDHFKDVNDTLGHHAGDALLTMVAQRLAGTVRLEDTVARLGGDEFAVIQVSPCGPEDARAQANRILAALRQPMDLAGSSIFAQCSIGITLYPDDAADPAGLLQSADLAMYRAKSERRNTFRFFDSQLDEEVRRRALLEQEMRSGLSRDEFKLVYQPKFCVRTGVLRGAEALLRWHHADGVVSPGEFIPIAERSGFIVELGDWVLRAACRQMAEWTARGLEIAVAVNLSATQFRSRDIPALVSRVIAETAIDPAMLELELTETTVMRDIRDAVAVLARLRALGVSLSIDDFGTGYSSLNYLHQLPVNKLKIDRSFITDVDKNASSATIARAIISLGHSLGMTIVAEGVETDAHYHFVREQRCEEVQGFLFGRPMPPEQLEALAARHQQSALVSV